MQNEEEYLKLVKSYQLRIELLEERLNLELRAKDKVIETIQAHNDYLQKLLITLSERPIINQNTIEVETVSDQSNSQTRNVNFNAAIQGSGYVEGNSYYYDVSKQKHSLTEAAVEIQKLLNQLSQTYPVTTRSEQIVVATKAMEELEKRPQLKQRVIGALQSGGAEALRELVDNPIINVLLALLEGWKSV
ncbi:MAG: hypothetical protein AAFR26_19870 [Cyanobacteria bacterium J06626_4]